MLKNVEQESRMAQIDPSPWTQVQIPQWTVVDQWLNRFQWKNTDWKTYRKFHNTIFTKIACINSVQA